MVNKGAKQGTGENNQQLRKLTRTEMKTKLKGYTTKKDT